MVADPRVPGYLGRVLDGVGDPAGTCFQVAAGALATAWHVLDVVGAEVTGAVVRVDPLAGGKGFDAVVARLDPVRDLAVLTFEAGGLAGCCGPLTAADEVPLRAAVAVTGHAVPDDPGHVYRYLDAPGEWAGGTTRDDGVPLGRMRSPDVVPGMSGAPVVRDDGHVAGVVSGRYNSADGWLAGSVWISRAEDLAALLDGVVEVSMARRHLAGPADLVLAVTGDAVRLTGPGFDVAAAHGGVRPGLADAVHDIRRMRARAGVVLRAQAAPAGAPAGELSLERAGRLLGESFLPGPVAARLAGVLDAAEAAHQPVRIGLDVAPGLAGLPWEALPGPDGQPLVLHRLVNLYRKTAAGAARPSAGPLRIVVAIAAPEDSPGGVVDYERHLRGVIAAVRTARADAAEVRVVPFATLPAIRAELDRAPAHVLHIYGHGQPGRLELENEDGTARLVTSAEFLAGAIPAGAMPPVVVLSACYTDAAASGDGGTSFAADLCAHGAAAVIGTETSVTDIYATQILARLYGELARTGPADVIAALARARRDVQAGLQSSASPRDQAIAALGEWAVVTVLAAAPAIALLDPDAAALAPPPRHAAPRIAGLGQRGEWYFVGRRGEQRTWPAELLDTPGPAGIVITGIGGTGKTTLAAQITGQVADRDPGRVIISHAGPLTLEGLLAGVVAALRRHILIHGGDPMMARALDAAARPDLPQADRYAILREHVLTRIPVLLVLDNFEDNLAPDGPGYAVADEALGGMLAAWAAGPGASRLLITTRYPFTLPGGADRHLSFRQLGPLSRAETMKLAWSLPALDQLTDTELGRVWRLAGGHPRSLEYLDALLAGGTARYRDVTARLHDAVTRRLHGADRDQWLAARTRLDAALAETAALAADDVLLDDLLARLAAVPGAARLLHGLAVYREPVDVNAVLFQAGQPDPAAENTARRQVAAEQISEILAAAGITPDGPLDPDSLSGEVREQITRHLAELSQEPVPPYQAPGGLEHQLTACQAASLLTITGHGPGRQFHVHRWTATELATRTDTDAAAAAHRQAAAYWRWRVRFWPQDKAAAVHDLLEARHHLLQAGQAEDADQVTEQACRQLHTWGAWDQEAALIHDILTRLPADSPRQADWVHRLGVLAHARGEFHQADQYYRQSLAISKHFGDQPGLALSYRNLGNLAQDGGDYDQAERYYQQSQAVSEQVGDLANLAATYGQLGNLAQDRSDYDQAERYYQQSLAVCQQLGFEVGLAINYQNLGNLAQHLEDDERASRYYQQSLAIKERLSDEAGLSITYQSLGVLAQRSDDYDKAERYYQQSLAISERLGDQASLATTSYNLGSLAQDRGDYDQAGEYYQRSLAISERMGDQASVARTYSQVGILEAERGGDTQRAVMWHVAALAIRLRLGVPEAAIDLWCLAEHRRQAGTDQFAVMLSQATSDSRSAEAVESLLDQFEAGGNSA